jgi:putative hydrolase of the HAD superfamily
MKLKRTRLGKYFDSAVTSFEMGYPKERIEFWKKVQKLIGFDKDITLFVDDTESVLKTARKFGIKYILYKACASSKSRPIKLKSSTFPFIKDYRELMSLDNLP